MQLSGWLVFAAILMMLAGAMDAINGLIALINDEVYLVTDESIVAFDFTTWGWIHLVLGSIMFLGGMALLSGALWARILAALLAVVVAVSQIAFIGAYPFWSIAIIGICVGVIYAAIVQGEEGSESV